MPRFLPLLVALGPLVRLHAAGVELHIEYSAIQKVLAQQAFADNGRMYVRNDARNRCSFAYLENPVVGGIEGRIQIQVAFAGRSATNLFGRCLGFGDQFAIRILATPDYDGSVVRLKDVAVETAKDTLYARKVREAITQDLPKKFQYPVVSEAKRILESRRGGEVYQQQLRRFQINAIKVTPEALVLLLEFTLVLK